jgi:hypothetical protein
MASKLSKNSQKGNSFHPFEAGHPSVKRGVNFNELLKNSHFHWPISRLGDGKARASAALLTSADTMRTLGGNLSTELKQHRSGKCGEPGCVSKRKWITCFAAIVAPQMCTLVRGASVFKHLRVPFNS